ncbi:MAG: gamma-glutamyl-gamma-aminobutyrate hydrolase family protein [Candidatus Paceibacterota bacterium]|jgi:putative glutamine amidotransferase
MKQKPIILVTSLHKFSEKGEGLLPMAVDPAYLNALYSCGAIPLIVPHGLKENELMKLADMAQGLLIPGGDDIHPKRYRVSEIHEKSAGISEERDELEITFAGIFIEKKKPIFGICRGEQIINVAMGGTLYQDIPSEMQTDIHHEYDNQTPKPDRYAAETHDVVFLEKTALASFFPVKKISVNSLHHQAVKDIAPGLRIAAVAPDGVIEAIESEDMLSRWILGVQWHPERTLEKCPENKIIFKKFIERAQKAAPL